VAEDQTLRDELSARGLKQAARFSWDYFAREFIDLLERRIAAK
jgi:glycosyltransferase involved in cell wall biosynthesis